jgi:hypothetical protein
MKRISIPIVACCAVALVACAPSPGPALPQAGGAATSADAGRLAGQILRGCRSAPDPRDCRDAALAGVLETGGVETALSTLRHLAARDRRAAREAHHLAHGIGIRALRDPAEVSATFARCTPEFESGCYHGVLQSYFMLLRMGASGRLTAEAVAAPCTGAELEASHFLRLQCLHGLGHGVAIFHDHDLPNALASCDLLPLPWEREACHAGAFMENVVAVIDPHSSHLDHHGGHGGQADHADHGRHDDRPAGRFPALDPDDLHFPCNAVEARYRTACYQLQTSAVLALHPGNLGLAAAMCAEAPAEAEDTCFQSLGRDVTAAAGQDPRRAAALCERHGSAGVRACHEGAARQFVNLAGRGEDGLRYCAVLPAGYSKRRCYFAVGWEIGVIEATATGRGAACTGAEPEHVADCLDGAGRVGS